jgi:lipopolysaccharide export system permease protein
LFLRILDKYLLKELLATFFAVLTVLLLITFGTEATKLLAMAVQGQLPAAIVMQVLLLKIPPALEVIMPLVALLSVMLAVGRLYQDQEMVVLNSCGVSPRYFQKIIVIFLVPLVLLTAWITLYVSPWSYTAERNLMSQAQVVAPVAGLVPGKFNSIPGGNGVIYAKSIEKSGQMQGVWIQYQSAEQDVVLSAPQGRFEWVNERVVLVLENGYSYQNLHRQDQALVVQQFARFEGFLPELSATPSKPQKYEVATATLWGSDSLEHQALLQWRLVTPLGLIVLGLLGLKLSKTGPRQGRFAKILLALVLYIIYNQFLVVGRDAVADGVWPVWLGLWPIPLIYLLLALSQARHVPNSKIQRVKGWWLTMLNATVAALLPRRGQK